MTKYLTKTDFVDRSLYVRIADLPKMLFLNLKNENLILFISIYTWRFVISCNFYLCFWDLLNPYHNLILNFIYAFFIFNVFYIIYHISHLNLLG